jgi:hypothetical protein
MDIQFLILIKSHDKATLCVIFQEDVHVQPEQKSRVHLSGICSQVFSTPSNLNHRISITCYGVFFHHQNGEFETHVQLSGTAV